MSLAVGACVGGGISCSKRGDAQSQMTVCFAFQDLETEFGVAGHRAIAQTLKAIESGEKTPGKWMDDPGFALTQANMAERSMDMWGFQLFAGACCLKISCCI